MNGVSFVYCIANDVVFSCEAFDGQSGLNGASFEDTSVLGSTFESADLRGAYLGTLIAHSTSPGLFTRDHVCFDGADLRGALIYTADIRGASFRLAPSERPANLTGADLNGANASGADFTGALMVACHAITANFEGANFTGADLRASRLDRCNLRGANLTNADLRLATLEGADLTGAILDGALLPADLVNLASREPEPVTEPDLIEAEPY